MENERLQINMAQGMNKAEVILREGAAKKELDVLPPIRTNIAGTIGAVTEYLSKRVNTGQFEQKDCYILVCRENVQITLVVNESDPYRQGVIYGRLEMHPKFSEFGINCAKCWTPTELGAFLKMNRTWFKDRSVNMTLVSTLMNFVANINNKIERNVSENGSKTDNFSQVVNSNLPASFNIEIPIFKGSQPVSVEVETLAKVDGRDVSFLLISPGAQEVLEEYRDKVIDEQLAMIREIAPAIAIIEQ